MNHSNHAFKEFDQSLLTLETQFTATIDKILQMNDLCQRALKGIADKEQVEGYLKQARALDKEINTIENENIAVIQNIIGKYTPRGRDLRFIIGSVKLATLLESTADKLKNSIKRMVKMETPPGREVTAALQKMLEESRALMQILPKLLDEFDEEISAEMITRRRQIEAHYREVWLQKATVDVNYHNTVMLAKNIERMADLSNDLRKIIYFIHTGERLRKKKTPKE